MSSDGKYYARNLAADRLRCCYELAPPRVQQYLQAEIKHVLDKVRPTDAVLELGCGYGRVLESLCLKVRFAAGIDNAPASLQLAQSRLVSFSNYALAQMDASSLGFVDAQFDVVVCIQNGISAFGIDPIRLISEAVRVTRPGGTILFSSYAKKFWKDRLEWFELQSNHGLLGPIDEEQTRDGVIVCRDGFRSTTFGVKDFVRLGCQINVKPHVEEVDGSSLFCEILVK